jgi:hypothetical protein
MGCLTPPPQQSSAWYGSSAAWRMHVESQAKRAYGPELSVTQTENTLTYSLAGLEVRGRRERVPVTINFHAPLPSLSLSLLGIRGIDPADFPQVFADPGASSKHRNPDGSLCLYYVRDPVHRRWTAERGLLSLLDLTSDHLFFEDYWRSTGGIHGGEWLSPEAPHGFSS